MLGYYNTHRKVDIPTAKTSWKADHCQSGKINWFDKRSPTIMSLIQLLYLWYIHLIDCIALLYAIHILELNLQVFTVIHRYRCLAYTIPVNRWGFNWNVLLSVRTIHFAKCILNYCSEWKMECNILYIMKINGDQLLLC